MNDRSLISDGHLIDRNVVRSGRAVAVKLNRVGELIASAGEERVVRDVHREALSIHGKRIMNHSMGCRVIVIFRHNVVPCSGREVGEAERR